jgi:hypothetical protein
MNPLIEIPADVADIDKVHGRQCHGKRENRGNVKKADSLKILMV